MAFCIYTSTPILRIGSDTSKRLVRDLQELSSIAISTYIKFSPSSIIIPQDDLSMNSPITLENSSMTYYAPLGQASNVTGAQNATNACSQDANAFVSTIKAIPIIITNDYLP
jgi:hypothetical protein